jgi:hypothetical protein
MSKQFEQMKQFVLNEVNAQRTIEQWDMAMDRNPAYYQLRKDNHIIGFMRETTEFLLLGSDRWVLESLGYNPDETVALTTPPEGIACLRRPSLSIHNKKSAKSKLEGSPLPY